MTMTETLTTAGIGKHGAQRLPSVDVDSYNIEIKDEDGFVGDRASKGAFHEILDELRKPLMKADEDPFGGKPSEELSKKALDQILVGDDVQSAVVCRARLKISPTNLLMSPGTF